MKPQNELNNTKLRTYPFLEAMYNDGYFPDNLVDKGKTVLIEFCNELEEGLPESLSALYDISNEYVEKFNLLQEDFEEAGSELETAARESICMDFEAIAKAYGFEEVDVEELTGERDF